MSEEKQTCEEYVKQYKAFVPEQVAPGFVKSQDSINQDAILFIAKRIDEQQKEMKEWRQETLSGLNELNKISEEVLEAQDEQLEVIKKCSMDTDLLKRMSDWILWLKQRMEELEKIHNIDNTIKEDE